MQNTALPTSEKLFQCLNFPSLYAGISPSSHLHSTPLCCLNRLSWLCGPRTSSGKLTAHPALERKCYFWRAGRQANDILTYTTTRNEDCAAEKSTQALQLACTGAKQHSQHLFLPLPLPAPRKNIIQVVSPKPRLIKVFSNSESLARWQRSTRESHHSHWAESSSEATHPKQHTGLPPHPWPLPTPSSFMLLSQQ